MYLVFIAKTDENFKNFQNFKMGFANKWKLKAKLDIFPSHGLP